MEKKLTLSRRAKQFFPGWGSAPWKIFVDMAVFEEFFSILQCRN